MSVFWQLTFCLFGYAGLGILEKDWCEVRCNGTDAQHTLCQFPIKMPGPKCVDMVYVMTEAVQDEFLIRINELRQYVAEGSPWTNNLSRRKLPRVADMSRLYWDNELEVIAQRHAIQCGRGEHDKCRDVDRFPVGQNTYLFEGSHGGLRNPADSIDQWLKKSPLFDFQAQSKSYDGTSQREFVQMIWSRSQYFGCSAISYRAGVNNNLLITCNFGPAGAIPGEYIFKDGQPCTDCLPESECKPDSNFNHLCYIHGEKDDEDYGLQSLRINSYFVFVISIYIVLRGMFVE